MSYICFLCYSSGDTDGLCLAPGLTAILNFFFLSRLEVPPYAEVVGDSLLLGGSSGDPTLDIFELVYVKLGRFRRFLGRSGEDRYGFVWYYQD